MDKRFLEIIPCTQAGYHPLVYFGGWRVAFLNDTPKFHRENVHEMQRHTTSDEVFLLLNGSCTLYTGDGKGKDAGNITSTPMAPLCLYNIKAGVWHTHITAPGTTLAIIENADVSSYNTDTTFVDLPDK